MSENRLRVPLTTIGALVVGLVGVFASVAIFSASPLYAALSIFFVSLLALSTIAALYPEVAFWRYVDYLWVSSTLVTILINVSANYTGQNLKNLTIARQDFRTSLSGVIFQLESTIDRYCGDNPSGNAPGPGDLYSCRRMRHLLYQVHGDYRGELLNDVASMQLPQNWASDFCLRELVPGHEQWNIYSESGLLCPEVGRFTMAAEKIQQALAYYDANKSLLDRAVETGGVRYWYFLYAVLAALRL